MGLWGSVVLETLDEALRVVFDHHHFPVLGAQEFLGDHAFEENPEGIEVAVNVEEATRFVMEAELAPGPNLEHFLERADTARQSDKTIREVRHHGLAFVHGGDNTQFGETAVREFLGFQVVRDDADNLPAGLEHGVSHGTHQAGLSPAINQADIFLSKERTDRPGRLREGGIHSGVGPAEDTDAFEVSHGRIVV